MRGIFEVTIVQLLTYITMIARLYGFKRKITYISDSAHEKPRKLMRISYRH